MNWHIVCGYIFYLLEIPADFWWNKNSVWVLILCEVLNCDDTYILVLLEDSGYRMHVLLFLCCKVAYCTLRHCCCLLKNFLKSLSCNAKIYNQWFTTYCLIMPEMEKRTAKVEDLCMIMFVTLSWYLIWWFVLPQVEGIWFSLFYGFPVILIGSGACDSDPKFLYWNIMWLLVASIFLLSLLWSTFSFFVTCIFPFAIMKCFLHLVTAHPQDWGYGFCKWPCECPK